MNNKVAAFGQRRAGVYLLSEIYNPDDTTSSVQNINKVIPAIGSLVVDDTIGEHNTLYVVYSVDAVTHKCTLVSASIMESADMVGDTRDLRMLFGDTNSVDLYYETEDTTRQAGVDYYVKVVEESGDSYSLYTGDFVSGTTYYERKDLYALQIDGRISVYTSTATDYTIYHTATAEGTTVDTEVVSQYYIEDGLLQEDTAVPMDQITIPATDPYGEATTTDAYRPRICYAPTKIIPGDKYLVVVRSNGHVISQFTITGQYMSALADLNDARKTIIDITVSGSQYDSDHNYFYISQDQKLEQLTFYLRVQYEDDYELVQIDNINAFMYTEGDVSTAITGSEIPIVFKYFPSHAENLGVVHLDVPGVSGKHYSIGPTGRYATVTSSIKIVDSAFGEVSKIAPILYCSRESPSVQYGLIPLIYKTDYTDPSVAVDFGSKKAVVDFNGGNFNDVQIVKLNYYKNSNDVVSTKTQNYQIKLNNPATSEGINYYFSDTGMAIVYGKDPRPAMRQVSGNSYRFTISDESGNFTIKDDFLKRYFYNANPPKPYNAQNPNQPTHFRIRKITVGSGTAAIAASAAIGPTSIDSFFGQATDRQTMNASATLHSTGSVPAAALLEFLIKNADNSYKVLYGVPVDVIKAS